MIPLLGISVEGVERLVTKGEEPENRLIQPSELEYKDKCEENQASRTMNRSHHGDEF